MPLVVHYWADLQSVHGLRCYGNITRTQNVSEYMLVLALCLVVVDDVVISRDRGKLVTRVCIMLLYSNAIHAPIANPPNSAQLRGIPYHSTKLHPGPCNSVDIRPWTDTQTYTQTRVTTIHFVSSTTHAKRNNGCLL